MKRWIISLIPGLLSLLMVAILSLVPTESWLTPIDLRIVIAGAGSLFSLALAASALPTERQARKLLAAQQASEAASAARIAEARAETAMHVARTETRFQDQIVKLQAQVIDLKDQLAEAQAGQLQLQSQVQAEIEHARAKADERVREVEADMALRIIQVDSHLQDQLVRLQSENGEVQEQLAAAATQTATLQAEYEARLANMLSHIDTEIERTQIQETNDRHAFYLRLDHEFRQPLQGIYAAADNLLNFSDTEQMNREAAHQSLTIQVKQLANLVEDLRDYAEVKIKMGKLRNHFELLDLGELLTSVLKQIKIEDQRASKRRLRDPYVQRVPMPLPHIAGTESLLRRAFRNLIHNAIKYTEDGGLVQVAVQATDDQRSIIIKISDDGCGIPKEYQEAVWKEFVRVPGSNVDGRGMGLTLVDAVVALHGGQRALKCAEAPHTGTTIIITLPAAPTLEELDLPIAGTDVADEHAQPVTNETDMAMISVETSVIA